METKLYEKLDSTDTEVLNKLGILTQIVIGGFPLDIGTSLAFESIFKPVYEPYDPDRPIPNKINIANYSAMLINVKTLFRNTFSSIRPDESRIIRPDQYAYFIRFEMNVIRSLLLNEGLATTQPIFYINNYKKVYNNKYPLGVRLRKPDTEKQLLYNNLLDKTIKILEKEKDLEIIVYNNIVDTTYKGNVLMLTHIPYDLFSYKYFKKLDLIESYTGILKTRMEWPSKYYNGKDYLNIPFNINLIKILGDHEMFHPMPIKYRNTLKELANKHNWQPLTTSDKITYDILHHLKDNELVDIYKQLNGKT